MDGFHVILAQVGHAGVRCLDKDTLQNFQEINSLQILMIDMMVLIKNQ